MSDSEVDSTPELPPELSALEEGDPEAIGPYAVVGRLGAGGMGAVSAQPQLTRKGDIISIPRDLLDQVM